ncbi:MAG: permease [Gemmatimonas sp. SG8_17]|nr:MAG: permease [Gemmatimonas sp. SG8_17]
MGFWRFEWKAAVLLVGGFLASLYLPVERIARLVPMPGPLTESLLLVRWYAREHVLLCLVPAFFIAGAIGVFVSHGAVLKYLGPKANKALAYGVAAVSGGILAVCSCTVLPLFAGIYKRGAGLGPASAFLYSGPAINVLAIILTARVLGVAIGTARAVGAVLFAVVVGIAMHLIFRKEELAKAEAQAGLPEQPAGRPLWQTGLFFAAMIAILVFANWGAPAEPVGLWHALYAAKWWLTALASLLLALVLVAWYGLPWRSLALPGIAVAGTSAGFPSHPVVPFATGVVGLSALATNGNDEMREWFASSWTFAKQILPLLLVGVLVAGMLLGRPGQEGLIPSAWISAAVGGNSLFANLFASAAGALMYFATLTEVPILEGLLGNGMGQGPALALLLAGPALSLPNMLVIRSVIGTKKTLVFVGLTVVMAASTGLIYGALVG